MGLNTATTDVRKVPVAPLVMTGSPQSATPLGGERPPVGLLERRSASVGSCRPLFQELQEEHMLLDNAGERASLADARLGKDADGPFLSTIRIEEILSFPSRRSIGT